MAKKPGWGPLPRQQPRQRRVSADAAVKRHVAASDRRVNGRAGAASARRVSGCAWTTVRVGPARVGACGLTGAPIRLIPAAFSSFRPDADGGVGGERR